mmetsp:Transcript_29619/g.74491  ORF Transcript_29619/g.74491 Transcript_29619/m.74491 type:complete len:315 (+) Transcript_29619:184-1128(+)
MVLLPAWPSKLLLEGPSKGFDSHTKPYPTPSSPCAPWLATRVKSRMPARIFFQLAVAPKFLGIASVGGKILWETSNSLEMTPTATIDSDMHHKARKPRPTGLSFAPSTRPTLLQRLGSVAGAAMDARILPVAISNKRTPMETLDWPSTGCIGLLLSGRCLRLPSGPPSSQSMIWTLPQSRCLVLLTATRRQSTPFFTTTRLFNRVPSNCMRAIRPRIIVRPPAGGWILPALTDTAKPLGEPLHRAQLQATVQSRAWESRSSGDRSQTACGSLLAHCLSHTTPSVRRRDTRPRVRGAFKGTGSSFRLTRQRCPTT